MSSGYSVIALIALGVTVLAAALLADRPTPAAPHACQPPSYAARGSRWCCPRCRRHWWCRAPVMVGPPTVVQEAEWVRYPVRRG